SRQIEAWPSPFRNGFDNDEGLGERIVVGNRQMNQRPVTLRRKLAEALGRAAGQLHGGFSARQIHHPHIAPEHAARQTGAERLGTSLLGREAFRVGGGALAPAVGLALFDLRKDTLRESLAVARQRLLDE